MTPQEKYLAAGGVVLLASKFYFKKPLSFSIMAGLAAISALAIITAKSTPSAS